MQQKRRPVHLLPVRVHQLLRDHPLRLAMLALVALLPAANGGLSSRGAHLSDRGASLRRAPSEAGAAALRLRGGHGGGCPCDGATKTMMWLYDEVCLRFSLSESWMSTLSGEVFRFLGVGVKGAGQYLSSFSREKGTG